LCWFSKSARPLWWFESWHLNAMVIFRNQIWIGRNSRLGRTNGRKIWSHRAWVEEGTTGNNWIWETALLTYRSSRIEINKGWREMTRWTASRGDKGW
jgi:hypothetical protein